VVLLIKRSNGGIIQMTGQEVNAIRINHYYNDWYPVPLVKENISFS